MPSSIVLTVIGPDRPGIVSALSDRASTFGANWLDARMAYLAGQFAGIVHLQVPDAQVERLTAALRELEASGLHVEVARAAPAPAPSGRVVALDLVGQDKPGIVREVSRTLAASGVSIEEFESGVVSGAMSGESLFKARARLRIPPGMGLEELRGTLEAMANEIMVDIELGDPGATR